MKAFSDLLKDWYQDEATPEEQQAFLQGLASGEEWEPTASALWETSSEAVEFFTAEESEAMLSRILPVQKAKVIRMPAWRAAAAVAIILMIGFGSYLLFFPGKEKPTSSTPTVEKKIDIA